MPVLPASRAVAPVVVEQVGQGERQVLPVAVQLPPGELERLLLGAHHARVGAQIAQGRHPALADDAFGVLADHAQHADHGAGVVAQRAVGEGVVASPPGSRTAPGTAAAPRPRSPSPWPARCRCAGRCRPRSPPTPRWQAGRAPTGTCGPGCRAGRRRCRRTSAAAPRPSTSRSGTTAGCPPPSAGSAARTRAARAGWRPSPPRPGHGRPPHRRRTTRPRPGLGSAPAARATGRPLLQAPEPSASQSVRIIRQPPATCGGAF